MGNTASDANTGDCTISHKCECFTNDRRIKNVDILRYSNVKWLWSTGHDIALKETLHILDDTIPEDIASLIKYHSYHDSQKYDTVHPELYHEKYYTKQSQLLHKKLCKHWYSNSICNTNNMLIALHMDNKETDLRILAAMRDELLPALRPQNSVFPNECQQIHRTMHIDECQIRLHLMSLQNNENKFTDTLKKSHYSDPAINLVFVKESDALQRVNKICRALWDRNKSMKNCIMVKVKDIKRKTDCCTAMDEFAAQWNIPCVPLCVCSKRAVVNLLEFAVKYYWFSDVVQ